MDSSTRPAALAALARKEAKMSYEEALWQDGYSVGYADAKRDFEKALAAAEQRITELTRLIETFNRAPGGSDEEFAAMEALQAACPTA